MHKKDNLFTIGEIANAIGITRRMILNYEEHGLIQPDLKEEPAGNRYYTIDTLTKIRTVRNFQNLGLSLKEIGEYFDDSSNLLPFIKRLETIRDTLNLNIEKLYERAIGNANEITLKELDGQTVYCRTFSAKSVTEKANLLRECALYAICRYGSDTSKRVYFTEYNIETPNIVTYCVAVPPESRGDGIVHTKKQKTLCLCHHGAYEDIPAVRDRLIACAKENGYTPAGTCRHAYIEGPPQHKDKSKFITHILLPIQE